MNLAYDINSNIVFLDMTTATALIDAVASGAKPMQLVCSSSGFGKSSIAYDRLRRHGIRVMRPDDLTTAMRRAVQGRTQEKPQRWKLAIEAKPQKPISLVRALYRCHMLDAAALLFDDPGKFAYDEDCCDVMKTGFGFQHTVTFESPEITRNELWRESGHRSYDPFIPPPRFAVPGTLRWLWLANTNFADPALRAKLADSFAPLVARGLSPFWIRDDREHDYRDLFLYVWYMATEKNLLRAMGFPYEVSRQAVNFYVANANRLIDLPPRRLELIARCFAAKVPQAARDAELESMLPKGGDQRPKLRLPSSWVTVPSGTLLWPEQPFRKLKTDAAPSPEPEPDPEPPEPPPPITNPPPTPEFDAEPPQRALDAPAVDTGHKLRPIPGGPPDAPIPPFPVSPNDTEAASPDDPEPLHKTDPPLSPVEAVYRLPIPTSCSMVADVLRQYPLAEWVEEELRRLAEALGDRGDWTDHEHESLAHDFCGFDPSTKLFATASEVLIYEDGQLKVLTWQEAAQRVAADIAKARQRKSKPRSRAFQMAARRENEPIDVPFQVVEPQPPPVSQVLALPAPEFLSLGEAIATIYRYRQYTCEGVAKVLRRCNLSQLDDEDFHELAERLDGCAEWQGEHNDLAHAFCLYESTANVVFGTSHGVLFYENGGLHILTWSAVAERIAPQLAEQAKKDELRRAEQRAREIFGTKLPAKRKLKKMQRLLNELLSLPGAKVIPERQAIVDRIRAMTEDVPQFAECRTFLDYITRAADITGPPQQGNLISIRWKHA